MRHIIYSVILVLILIGCKTNSYFFSANEVSLTEGSVYLLNGEEKKGLLTIKLEKAIAIDQNILLKNGNTEEKIPVSDVKYFKIRNELFFPKIIIPEADGIERLLFLKQLAGEQSRMSLYELFRHRTNTDDGKDIYMYFLSVPGLERLQAWNLANKNLVPHFDEKMSRLVSGCPALEKKIRGKEKGYFMPQFSFPDFEKADVLKRIIAEYDSCR